MLRNPTPNFFQPLSNTGSSENSDAKLNVTIIIDPNIFFVSYHGKYYIHPIIRVWLNELKLKNQLKICLLSRSPCEAVLEIGNKPNPYLVPINIHDDSFKTILHPDSKKYIADVFNNKFEFVIYDPGSRMGIYIDDENDASINNMIVVTANPDLYSLFKRKNISAALMEPKDQPFITTPSNDLASENKCEIYCDFDETLFKTSEYIALQTILPLSRSTVNDVISESENPLFLLQEKTISLLKRFQHHPVFLLTQRTGVIDEIQPKCNNAIHFVKLINEKHGLKIKADGSSYLNSHIQIELNKNNPDMKDSSDAGYMAKIEVLYLQMKERPVDLLPQFIVLIDDDIREIAKCDSARPYFEALGIELHIILIMNPRYYYMDKLTLFKEGCPDIFNLLKESYCREMKKLKSAFEYVKENQKTVEDAPVTQSLETTAKPSKRCGGCNLF